MAIERVLAALAVVAWIVTVVIGVNVWLNGYLGLGGETVAAKLQLIGDAAGSWLVASSVLTAGWGAAARVVSLLDATESIEESVVGPEDNGDSGGEPVTVTSRAASLPPRAGGSGPAAGCRVSGGLLSFPAELHPCHSPVV